MRKSKFSKRVKTLTATILALVMCSCGTILYPNRRGQQGGHVDVGVVVMDGLLMLLFFVPGVAAFVVDFATGAIYVPGTHEKVILRFDPETTTEEELEAMLSDHFGTPIDLDAEDVVRIPLQGKEREAMAYAEE